MLFQCDHGTFAGAAYHDDSNIKIQILVSGTFQSIVHKDTDGAQTGTNRKTILFNSLFVMDHITSVCISFDIHIV